MFWLFCIYIIIAYATYSFGAIILLFDMKLQWHETIEQIVFLIIGAMLWPLYFIYLYLCNKFNWPNRLLNHIKE